MIAMFIRRGITIHYHYYGRKKCYACSTRRPSHIKLSPTCHTAAILLPAMSGRVRNVAQLETRLYARAFRSFTGCFPGLFIGYVLSGIFSKIMSFKIMPRLSLSYATTFYRSFIEVDAVAAVMVHIAICSTSNSKKFVDSNNDKI